MDTSTNTDIEVTWSAGKLRKTFRVNLMQSFTSRRRKCSSDVLLTRNNLYPYQDSSTRPRRDCPCDLSLGNLAMYDNLARLLCLLDLLEPKRMSTEKTTRVITSQHGLGRPRFLDCHPVIKPTTNHHLIIVISRLR
jgi:hypothetical protein